MNFKLIQLVNYLEGINLACEITFSSSPEPLKYLPKPELRFPMRPKRTSNKPAFFKKYIRALPMYQQEIAGERENKKWRNFKENGIREGIEKLITSMSERK